MAKVQCKMCGGKVELSANVTYAECPYCGSATTFPKLEDSRKEALYNRAEQLRRSCDFDKALQAYERILEIDDSDPEIYWGIVLCRYGIEYVEDPVSHERIPTCHRARMESLLNDNDYKAAVDRAMGNVSVYESEAKRISEIQKGILSISSQEKPYDVFICYKETTQGGSRTKDSTIAQDIYYQLTNEGYKTFFARITLEDKLGQQYEPYIFAALNSAKVMLVIGSCKEHFEAVWVRNEWSRYLELTKKDRSRLLIPCYKDMDPYDIPSELSMLQCHDIGKIGFLQDLLHGIKKVLGKSKKDLPTLSLSLNNKDSAKSDVVVRLLKKAYIAKGKKDFATVSVLARRILDVDDECIEAWLLHIDCCNNPVVAKGAFERIIEIKPECAEYYLSAADKMCQFGYTKDNFVFGMKMVNFVIENAVEGAKFPDTDKIRAKQIAAKLIDKYFESQPIHKLKTDTEKTTKYIKERLDFDSDNLSVSIFYAALAVGDLDAIQRCCEKPDTVDLINAQMKDPLFPLKTALKYNYMQVAKYFVHKVENINAADEEGNTLLISAIKARKWAFISILLDNGAKIDVCDKSGHSPLYYAIERKKGYDNSEYISTLLNAQGSSEFVKKDVNELLASMFAARKEISISPATLRLLLSNVADPNLLVDGQNLLMLAIHNSENSEIVRVLLECGADGSKVFPEGGTVMDHAVGDENKMLLTQFGFGKQLAPRYYWNYIQNIACFAVSIFLIVLFLFLGAYWRSGFWLLGVIIASFGAIIFFSKVKRARIICNAIGYAPRTFCEKYWRILLGGAMLLLVFITLYVNNFVKKNCIVRGMVCNVSNAVVKRLNTDVLKVVKCVIPEGVKEIGSSVFKGGENLQSVVFPRSLTKIGPKAFSGCRNLQNITLPPGVLYIEDGAFEECENLQSVMFSRSLTKIGPKAFSGCCNLQNITLPSGVLYIGKGAFEGCRKLQKVIFPEGIQEIESGAFVNCSLTEAVLPSNCNVSSDAFACDIVTLDNLSYKYYISAQTGDIAAQYELGKCFERVKNYTKALEWYKNSAAQGNPDAQYKLGKCYYLGRGVEKNHVLAFRWYKKSAEQGNSDAQYELGECHYYGKGVEKDYIKAFAWYKKSAEQGNPDAQYKLGKCYYLGRGVKKNNTQAIEWYTKSAEQGNVNVLYRLGECYYYGYGVEKDYIKAFAWYKKSAEQGNPEAQYNLGECYYYGRGVKKNYAQAIGWYKKSAEQGNAEAQYSLGWCYYYGYGVEKDYIKAFAWYKKSAEQGNAVAQCYLGFCYEHGIGVEKDNIKAFEWYKKSAARGHPYAQYKLGECYYYGRGVEKNYAQAIEWYKKSAEQGHSDAQAFLGDCYYLGRGVRQDYDQAFEWYKKSAEQGNVGAQGCLGACYYSGHGVERDYRAAMFWLQKAASKGNKQASNFLKQLRENKKTKRRYIFRTR